LLKEAFHFIYPWRTYQERFLKDFKSHASDDHLHVVAPPGSGKTVLGLEMMRRVNQKTLVLAPTITIRNQWEQRMFECFVSEEDCTIPLSRNIKEPAHITFATYQSLHAFSKNEMEGDMDRLVAFFAEAGIKHIVLDEAHHLKNEWWKPLFALKKLEGTLTALTATNKRSRISKRRKSMRTPRLHLFLRTRRSSNSIHSQIPSKIKGFH
jgi:superfamily II DNA or RNA helicase